MSSHISNFLTGENIYLRPLEPCDSDYFQWFNDAEICAGNSHHVYPMNRTHVLDYIDSLDNRKDVIALAIIFPKADKHYHIGNVSLQNIHPINRSAELAIIMGRMHGHGFGFEACKLIVNHGFSVLGLHRITYGTFRHNIAMQKIALKLGMKLEGIRRQAAWKDGEWADVFEYGMVRFDK